MFSSRLPSSLAPNEFTELLEEKKSTGQVILDLTQSNPTAVGLSIDCAATKELCNKVPTTYEPSAQGLQIARTAIEKYYLDNHYGLIDSDDLFLTASTSEAYSFLFKLLTDPGDEILIPAPSYPLFDLLATLENLTPTRYRLFRNQSGHWRIDFPSLLREISPLTKAIVVVNPNNPTGSSTTREEFVKLTELCRSHQLALIVDEVFLDYQSDSSLMPPCSAVSQNGALIFTLSGFSKILALPQVKLSWIHVEGPAALKEGAKRRLEFIADTYLSVNAMVQHQAATLFSQQRAIQTRILARIKANERVLKAATDLASCLREGGWYAIIILPDFLSDEQCCLELLEHHLLVVHPGFFYDIDDTNCIVVSLITSEDSFLDGIGRLQTYLQNAIDKGAA